MKKLKIILFAVTALLCITSCEQSDGEAILRAQKASSKKLTEAWEKFADDFFMYGSLKKSGSSGCDVTITDLQSSDIPPESVRAFIDKKIGLRADFANDNKKKEYRYSYKLKNFFKGEPETEALDIKIGNKNIEAAIPLLLQKTFTLKCTDVGQAVERVLQKKCSPPLNFTLSYDKIKKSTLLKLDQKTKKGMEAASRTLYKNANIKRTGNLYTVKMDGESLNQYQKEMLKTLREDSLISGFIELYKAILPEETFAEFEKTVTEAFEKPNCGNSVLELVINNGLIEKCRSQYTCDNGRVIKLDAEIDYNHPLTTGSCTISFPMTIGKETVNFALSFGSKGTYEKGKADITVFADMGSVDMPEKFSININFFADTSKSVDNFHTNLGFIFLPQQGKGDAALPLPVHPKENEVSDLALSASGSITKTPNEIIYNIDTILMNIRDKGKPTTTVRIGTDAEIFFSKNVPAPVALPKEKLDVLNAKPEDWAAVQKEMEQNLTILKSPLNLQ